MTTLPTTDVYGKRESLRVNRIDRPSTGGVELAQAYSDAIASFNQAYQADLGRKKDLNYALARNEILMADLEERDKLSQDADWATHDQRYGEGLKARTEEIRAKYTLDPYDAQLLDAEIKMISAKGRIDVTARARGIEIDQGYSNLVSNLEQFREMVINAKTGDRNQLMEAALQSIDIAEENGYFGVEGATNAQLLREKTTQDFAGAVLDSMDAEERQRLIGASLAYRRGYGVGEYGELVRAASAKYGLPPELIAAQMDLESAGDPEAKSGAFGDPTGLMQLGEAAAKDMGVTDRTDPAQSIDGGARYDAEMLKRFDGDKAKALAAYNWGPKNVMEVWDKYGDDWLEHVPEETKTYVAKLLPYWEGTAEPDKYMLATNTGQGPLTRGDIQAGKGTGSVADFLHTDTLAKMYEQAHKEGKEERERTQAQGLVDQSYELFPNDHAARMKFVKDNSSGDVRKKAETDLELENNRQLAEERRQGDELYNNYAKTIEEWAESDSPLKFSEIPQEHKNMMTAAQLKALELEIQNQALGIQHPAVTQYIPTKDGSPSLEMWMALPNHGPGGKTEVDLEDPQWRQAFDREMYYTIRGQQADLKLLEQAQVPVKSVGPLVADVVRARGFGGVTNTKEQDAMISRLELRLSADVAKAQQSKVPPRALTDTEIREIMSGYFMESAYYNDWGFDDLRRDWAFTTEQQKTAYLPITEAHDEMYAGPVEKFRDLSMYEYLKERSREILANQKGAEDNDIARAFWAYKRGLSTDQVESRLRGE